MRTPTPQEKLLSTIGLCARARKLVMGTSMVCDSLRGGKHAPFAVLEATDTSDNTHQKLRAKCAYYGKPLYRLPATGAELGHAIGKTTTIAAVAVTDENLLRALAPYLPEPETLPEVTRDEVDNQEIPEE